MIDPFGRSITYLRVSVTDRCDLRCVYCMAEDMTFLPKAEVLSLEELDRICSAFIRLGTKKIRITGGEPLVRRDVMTLFGSLGRRIGDGLDELTVTTNGTQLARYATGLREAGVRRVNVSLDTLDGGKFKAITRLGRMEQTLDGIFAAKAAGLAVKINAVAMKGVNEDEFDGMLAWCGEHGFDLCLIETMPMGDITGDRTDQYLPLSIVRSRLRKSWTLSETDYRTGGPARYFTVEETGRRIGFITPMTHNFCESCNRVRLTGGEPLVRRNVMSLVRSLSRHLDSGALDELTLTTNGSQLARFASVLRDCGVRRINVSLDTLDPARFKAITRWGDIDKVLAGIEAARAAGLAVKINAVALKNVNEDEIPALMEWAHGKGMTLTLIEVMPMGDIGTGRIDQYLPLSLLRSRLATRYTLTDLDDSTGGPARYVQVSETGGKIGFITPMTHNFCESCNRVRVTCTGTIHTCLGHEDASDLRRPLRASPENELLSQAIDRAIGLKPKGHDFVIDRRHNRPSVSRHMSVTGG